MNKMKKNKEKKDDIGASLVQLGEVLAKGMIELAKTSSGGNDHLDTAITSLTGVVEDLAKQNTIVLKKIQRLVMYKSNLQIACKLYLKNNKNITKFF
jgi:3-oxoacyl-[acyl-carrier-protein] synthase III